MNSKRGVSIVVCTYNGAKRLAPTLQHIAQQVVDNAVDWEVILINNNSKDDTVAVAQAIWDATACRTTFSIVDEPQPGLSYAKARGLSEAQYSYLIFVDDDNSISANYVQTVFDIFENNPSVAVCSGDSEEAVPEGTNLPFWWEDFKYAYAVGKQGTEEGYLKNGFLWGASSAFRVAALQKLYSGVQHKMHLTGRIGNKLAAGEDAELCFALQQLGYQLYYTPRLQFKHHIPVDRVEDGYLLRLMEGFGAASVVLSLYSNLLKGEAPNWRSSFQKCLKSTLRKYLKLWKTRKNTNQQFKVKANLSYSKSRLQELLRYRSRYTSTYYKLKRTLT